jgi:hypothetical protein
MEKLERGSGSIFEVFLRHEKKTGLIPYKKAQVCHFPPTPEFTRITRKPVYEDT